MNDDAVSDPTPTAPEPVEGPPTPANTTSRSRLLFAFAAGAALVVSVIFATVGDGVDVPDATGLRAAVVECGHILVWMLLTLAFTIAAVRGRWTRLAGLVALVAGLSYAVFLISVLLWP